MQPQRYNSVTKLLLGRFIPAGTSHERLKQNLLLKSGSHDIVRVELMILLVF